MLLLLLFAYIFNFIDRNIIGVLAVPIREEFGLSDTSLSHLGVAFGVFYATIAIPIAWAADRKSRVNIIAGAVALWSLFTAVCGVVQTYTQLVIARMGVAVGEAGGIAPSYSLISDYFPREKRSRALAFYSLGIPIGSALGVFFGGWLAAHLSWRSAFVIVGLLGLPAALLIKLLIPEPERGRFDPRPANASAGAPPAGEVARALFGTPSFWLLSFGAASGSILGYGLIFWLPSFFNRSFGLEVADVGWFYGSIVLVGGALGTWMGGWLGDRIGPSRPGGYALIPAVCFIVTAPDLRSWAFRAQPVGRLAAVHRRADAGAGLAWTGDHRSPAHRPSIHESDRFGELPVHQQPDRNRLRDLLPRLAVRRDESRPRRRFAQIFDPLRPRISICSPPSSTCSPLRALGGTSSPNLACKGLKSEVHPSAVDRSQRS